MQVGETVTIRTTGQRARITAELPDDRFQVEYLWDAAQDPLDRDSSRDEDLSGVYAAADLEPLTA